MMPGPKLKIKRKKGTPALNVRGGFSAATGEQKRGRVEISKTIKPNKRTTVEPYARAEIKEYRKPNYTGGVRIRYRF